MVLSNTRRSLLLLEKCRNMKQLKETHAQIITGGLAEDNFALSRLMAFCSDPIHGSLNYARLLFERIEQPTICIRNTIIKSFLLRGEFINTIAIYHGILQDGLNPDNYTLPYVLKACANLQDCRLGEQIHTQVQKLGFVSDIFVGNTLILMYSACGNIKTAKDIFDEIPSQTPVSWTIMISGYSKQGDIDTARLLFDEAPVKDRGIWGSIISGYVQNNCFKEGLQIFRLFQAANLEPDEAVLVSVLCACAHLGALDLGTWIHRYLERIGLPLSVRLSTALIDMYVKCGNLDLAKKLFAEMPQRDIVCWNVMISGLGMHGDGVGALELFSEMQKAGLRPNDITFISVFTACSHSGMVEEGLLQFNSMTTVYGIEPKSEHYGCIVDFLSRSGFFEEVKEIIRKIPSLSSPAEEAIAWRALLSACCSHREIQLAEFAAEHLLQLDPHSGVYVLLSNIYSAEGKFDDARRIRKAMKDRGVEKTPGCSSIEVSGFVYEFIAGEKTHPQMDAICRLLEKMNEHLEVFRYLPDSINVSSAGC